LTIEKALANSIQPEEPDAPPVEKIKPDKNKSTINSSIKSFSFAKGSLMWPVQRGVIVSKFGKQAHPSIKGLYIENNGIDIKVEPNKTAKAVFSGIVISIQSIPGHNIMIMVQHDEYYTIYSKLSTNSVNIGQTISAGDLLGNIESTTLHFEIWKGKHKLNPNQWLKK